MQVARHASAARQMYVVTRLQLEQTLLDLPQIKATAFVHVVLLEYRPDTVYTKCSHTSVHTWPQCPLTFCCQNARVPGLPFPEARSALGNILREAIVLHIVRETYFSSSRVKSESCGTSAALDPLGTRHEKNITSSERTQKRWCQVSPVPTITCDKMNS
jgi:hypothetical protein